MVVRRESEQVGDGVEGDAGGSGFVGGEHGGGGEGGGAVFLVDGVDCLHEALAGLRVVECVEEVEGVEPVGDEVVEGDADEVGGIACGIRRARF